MAVLPWRTALSSTRCGTQPARSTSVRATVVHGSPSIQTVSVSAVWFAMPGRERFPGVVTWMRWWGRSSAWHVAPVPWLVLAPAPQASTAAHASPSWVLGR